MNKILQYIKYIKDIAIKYKSLLIKLLITMLILSTMQACARHDMKIIELKPQVCSVGYILLNENEIYTLREDLIRQIALLNEVIDIDCDYNYKYNKTNLKKLIKI